MNGQTPPPGFVLEEEQKTQEAPPPGFVMEGQTETPPEGFTLESQGRGQFGLGTATSIGPRKEKSIFSNALKNLKEMAAGVAGFHALPQQIAGEIKGAIQESPVSVTSPYAMAHTVAPVLGKYPEAMVTGYVKSWDEMIKDPIGFAKRRPVDALFNVLDGLTLIGGMAGKAVHVANVRKYLKAQKSLRGSAAKKIISEVAKGTEVEKVAEKVAQGIDDAAILNLTEEGAIEYIPQVGKPKLAIQDKVTGKVYNAEAGDMTHADMAMRLEKKGVSIDNQVPGWVTPEGKWTQKLSEATPPAKVAPVAKATESPVIKKIDDAGFIERDSPRVTETGDVARETTVSPPDEISPEAVESTLAKASESSPPPPAIDQVYSMGGDTKALLDMLGADRIKGAWKLIRQFFHSPDRVFRKSIPGMKIYDRLNQANLDETKWLAREFQEFESAAKGIKEGSPLSSGVFRAKDNSLTIGEVLSMSPDDAMKLGFTKDELVGLRGYRGHAEKFHKFLSEKFDYLLRRWGESKIGKDLEGKIWKAVSEHKVKPKSQKLIDALSPEAREVWDLYNKKISSYIPHIFTPQELTTFIAERIESVDARLARLQATPSTEKWLKGMIAKLNKEKAELMLSMDKVKTSAGKILYEDLPRRVRFKFFEPRRGAPGYNIDAIKAYKTYLAGIAKKIFSEPAIKASVQDWYELPKGLQEYARWYMRDYMGYNNNALTNLAGTVKSLMWTKALGLNPRSAIVNMFQKINTVADSHPTDAIRGYARGFTKEGKRLFEESGLMAQVPQQLWEGGQISMKSPAEAIRSVAGWMFRKAEEGNLRHAFMTGYEEGLRFGKTPAEAMKMGIAKAQKSQFRYGKVGTPRALRGVGGIPFQFWSYPIKQLEFLGKIARENPAKLLGWWGLSEGANLALQEFVDLDLSNAIGLGINYGELVELLQKIPEGDLAKISLQAKKVPAGGGILPYGLGPGVGTFNEVAAVLAKLWSGVSPDLDEIIAPVLPMTVQRGRQLYKSLREGRDEEGLYTIKSIKTGEPLYKETLPELIKRTTVAKPMEETRQQRAKKELQNLDKMRAALIQRIAELFVDGKKEEALAMARKYHIQISKDSIKAAMDRKRKTWLERRKKSKAKYPFEREMK